MPQQTPGQARVVDPILTAVARGYRSPKASIANILFPIVSVGARGGRILSFGPDDFKLVSTVRAPGANTKRVQFGYSTSAFSLVDYSLEGAVPIELQQHRHGVRVALVPDAELLRSAAFVFAVNAQMPLETLRARFAAQVKVGPVERLRDLVTLALPGIALHPLPVAPRQLPYHAGFSYFALDRGGELWKQVQQSAGGLGMHIAGEFPGLELECWALREH